MCHPFLNITVKTALDSVTDKSMLVPFLWLTMYNVKLIYNLHTLNDFTLHKFTNRFTAAALLNLVV